ncbi:MAG: glycoside hydrolase family 71/99-like protein [Salinivirgaceae bacterium]|jgi:hypothetical protein|nr:glycoside hydrolase family 71/99-like protein [Salinivirgaceae bacterium]
MKKLYFISFIIFSILFANCAKDNNDPEPEPEPEPEAPEGPVKVEKTNPMHVYVHYMPWFETPETNTNGNWGIHWKMANKNPENIDDDGKREIASHYYPLIGPYASSDKDVIEYHLLLMKYAGIDGLIIDWYGSSDINDFGMNRRNSEAVIDRLDEVGLQFALTYEDWTTNDVVGEGEAETNVEAAIEDFKYMEANYFDLETYIKINNNPLLTVFGPQAIQNGDDWTTILANISSSLTYLSLWFESGDLGSNATGEFSWVYEDNTHITNFLNKRMSQFDVAMGSAYPGFVDYYEEGGWGTSIDWEIDHANGATLDATLAMAANKHIDYLQLVTWNDFGEGTIIEPTLEFEYQYLEKIQEFTGVLYTKTEFEYITKLYNLRKSKADDADAQLELNKAFNYLVSLNVDEAKAVIDALD